MVEKKENNMLENKNQNLFGIMDEVLGFSSELIVLGLEGKKPDDSKVNKMRGFCKELSDAGVYQFQTICDNEKLFEQIQQFAQNVNG